MKNESPVSNPIDIAPNKTSVRRKILTGAAALLALLGARELVDAANKAPQTSAAEVAYFGEKNIPIQEGVLVVKSGAKVRTTPDKPSNNGGPNDPASAKVDKNVAFKVPKDKTLIVANPYKGEHGWLGFTVVDSDKSDGGANDEAEPTNANAQGLAEETYWVKANDLEDQGLAEQYYETWADPNIDAPAQATIVDSNVAQDATNFLRFGEK